MTEASPAGDVAPAYSAFSFSFFLAKSPKEKKRNREQGE
jgi:hypothetical protein